MVTAEVIEGKPEGKQEYPCTMVDQRYGLIVGFKAPGIGTVIAPGNTGWDVYDQWDNWYMREFIPFTGSVTLRNS